MSSYPYTPIRVAWKRPQIDRELLARFMRRSDLAGPVALARGAGDSGRLGRRLLLVLQYRPVAADGTGAVRPRRSVRVQPADARTLASHHVPNAVAEQPVRAHLRAGALEQQSRHLPDEPQVPPPLHPAPAQRGRARASEGQDHRAGAAAGLPGGGHQRPGDHAVRSDLRDLPALPEQPAPQRMAALRVRAGHRARAAARRTGGR